MRRTLKIIGRVAGGILGLGIALYLTAVAINWRDREPSAAAVRFANLYRQRPVVAAALMYPQSRHFSAKVRVFVDWVSELIQQDPTFQTP
jgi:DNA-binding transcriptional LysR family regulator